MSNPFHTFEVVVTDKLQRTTLHQVFHASSWRVEYFASDYQHSKDYKGYTVWVRRQLNSMEMSDNSGWSWNVKAKNEDESRDYAATVEWEPWVNVMKDKDYIRNLLEQDNELIRLEKEKQNATR